MLLFDEIREVNNERIIRAYGLNYERFLNLPKDIQEELLYSYNDRILQIKKSVEEPKIVKKLNKFLRR